MRQPLEPSVYQDLQCWIRPSIQPFQVIRSLLSPGIVEEAEEAVEAEEEVVGEEVKEGEETKEIKEVKEKRGKFIQGIRQPDMLTNRLNSPVDAIGSLASQLIFVKNLEPALGRTSGYQNLINEIQASPQQ